MVTGRRQENSFLVTKKRIENRNNFIFKLYRLKIYFFLEYREERSLENNFDRSLRSAPRSSTTLTPAENVQKYISGKFNTNINF